MPARGGTQDNLQAHGDAEAEDYQAELWRRVESCVWGMKRTELQAALLRLLAEGPEWQYERFAREYAGE